MPISSVVRIALAILAVYRLGELFAYDEGPFEIFERLRIRMGAYDRDSQGAVASSLGRFISCPYCLGVWFALVAIVPVLHPTFLGDAFLLWLGIAGGQSVLQGSRFKGGSL